MSMAMLWVLIRIASASAEAILMSTHNICFYGENYPSVIIKYPPYLFFRHSYKTSFPCPGQSHGRSCWVCKNIRIGHGCEVRIETGSPECHCLAP